MYNESHHTALWLAVSESICNIGSLSQEYVRKADELTESEPVNSINLRGQAIGLMQAIEIISKELYDRELIKRRTD